MKLRSAGVERFYLGQACWRQPLTPLAEFTLFSKEMPMIKEKTPGQSYTKLN